MGKVFGGVIAALVAFSLFTFPSSLSAGISYEKGLQAEKEKKYVTAAHYFKEVISKQPAHIEAKAHLLIASFYNNDMATFAMMADTLGGETVDDDALLDEVQALMNKAGDYFPSDSLIALFKKYNDISDSIPENVFDAFIKTDSMDPYAKITYASVLYDKKSYTKADSLLKNVLQDDEMNINALSIMSTLKRLEDESEESIKYCDKLLTLNSEYVYALSSKARTLLKMKKTEEGLQLAVKSIALDSSNLYGKATLALAYHFNSQPKERDKIIQHATVENDSASLTYFQFVLDVINNKDHL